MIVLLHVWFGMLIIIVPTSGFVYAYIYIYGTPPKTYLFTFFAGICSKFCIFWGCIFGWTFGGTIYIYIQFCMQNYTSCKSHRNLATDQLCKLCKVCWIEDWRLKLWKKLLQSRSSIFNPGLKKFFSELQSSIFNLQSWIEEVFLRSSIFNLQSSKLCKVCKFWMQRSRPNEAWKVTSDTKP